jgi:hypothetical protein
MVYTRAKIANPLIPLVSPALSPQYGPAAGLGCFDCGRGKFISTQGATSETQCSLCPIGKSSPATGLPSSCESCQLGRYAPAEGYAQCAICDPGTACEEEATEMQSCGAGSFSGAGAGTCTICGPTAIAPDPSTPFCLACDANQVSNANRTECVCQQGFYTGLNANEATPVPKGVSPDTPGLTLQTLDLLPGHYRTNSNSTEILPCLNEDHCVGGSDPSSYCAEGYTGPLCAVCSSGYAAIGAGESLSCNQCSGSSTATVAAGVTFVVVFLSVSIIQIFRDKDSTRGRLSSIDSAISAAAAKFDKVQPYIKVVFAYYQVVGGLGFLFGIKFPPIFSAVTSIFGGIVSLDFISFLPLGCMAPAHFYNTLLVYTLLPLLTSIVLIGAYFVLHTRTDRRSVFLCNKLFEVFLAMTFILLPSVSIKVFSTFACHHFDDGTSFLTVDYSIDCNASEHTFYRLYAGAMVFVYPIGIPFSYWYLLWRQREKLNGKQREKEGEMSEEKALKEALELRAANEEEHQSLKALSFLYGSYEPKYWWFEVFETLRKLALTGFLVFLAPGTAAQVTISIFMCMGAMRIYAGCKVRTGEAFTRSDLKNTLIHVRNPVQNLASLIPAIRG